MTSFKCNAKSCNNKKPNDMVVFENGSHFCVKCTNNALRNISPAVYNHSNAIKINYQARDLEDIMSVDKTVQTQILNFLNKGKVKSMKCPLTDNNQEEYMVKSPAEIYTHLDKYIISQNESKRAVSLAFNRFSMAFENDKINKINVMLVGPTASGKTEMIRTLTKMGGVEFLKVDCSHLTPSGYKGNNANSVLSRLISQCDGDVERAEKSVILLDEIDKLSAGNGTTGQFYNRVQQELLKMVEGDTFEVNMGDRDPKVILDTSNILFIAAGAFVGLGGVVKPKAPVGFSQKTEEVKKIKLTSSHLIKYGLIPELVGRFNSISQLEKLDVTALKRILKDKEDNLCDEYKEIFKQMGYEVEFTKKFINTVTQKASEDVTGARALRNIIEEILAEELFSQELKNNQYMKVKRVEEEKAEESKVDDLDNILEFSGEAA